MDTSEYLKQHQPLVYQTMKNAFENQRISHAYLLMGEPGVPLKETALFLAESILCDHPSPFADETCRTCHRIAEGNYPDFQLIDGSTDSIKKNDVSEVLLNFSQTALEKKGLMVYLIHEVENMTVEAINSLLKFLEEPSPNTYAILTTRNQSKVLPTILSRCETIRMVALPRNEVVKEATQQGVRKDDAEILSYFDNDARLIQADSQTPDYQNAKDAFLATIEALKEGRSYTRYIIEKTVIPTVNSKKGARFYLDMMAMLYEDLVSFPRGGEIHLSFLNDDIQALSSKLPHPDSTLVETMSLREDIDANIQLGLIFTHFATLIFKE